MWPLSYLALEVGICALFAQNSGWGPLRESEPVQEAHHPDLVPACGEREKRARTTCDGLAPPGSVADDTRPSVL